MYFAIVLILSEMQSRLANSLEFSAPFDPFHIFFYYSRYFLFLDPCSLNSLFPCVSNAPTKFKVKPEVPKSDSRDRN